MTSNPTSAPADPADTLSPLLASPTLLADGIGLTATTFHCYNRVAR